MDYRIFTKKEYFEEYITMFEDLGWKHIVGKLNLGTQYFINDNDEVQSELFSDEDSQKARIKRVKKMLRQTIAVSLVFFIILLSQNSITISAFLNPKELYLTPGLWDMNGSLFWSAFLAETPFAFFRGIILYVLPIIIIVFVILGYMLQHNYNKSLNAIKKSD
jgi:hypothetical protein